ncbi:hypothetical protein KBI33_00400 [Candidatus Shapirobacteria bacterium]|nr:hypothetical protein [Candidatus Shapirobacteria bacterium]
MVIDAKTIYAQSSDIKSRTYLEYRKDMKQKAIAELEVLPWLKKKIRQKDKKAVVEKFGGDKFIWFLRKGGITREPDFVAKYSNKETKYVEFQYAKKELSAYDFKISKIAPKNRTLNKRAPKDDTEILYVVKPTYEFAILSPDWIIKNSKQAIASAWGNAPVFRVPKEKFKKVLQKDKELKAVCDFIDKKISILDFQHKTIEMEENKLSYLLQQVIDEEKILKIIPKTIDGFFKVCFMLDHIEKIPTNANLWLVYILSFLDQSLNSYELFRLIYSLDFLYQKVELKTNELSRLVRGLKEINKQVERFSNPDGSFRSDKTIAPLEDTRYSLFIINILEDLTQDVLYYYGNNINLRPITRIYQTVPQINKTFQFVMQ